MTLTAPSHRPALFSGFPFFTFRFPLAPSPADFALDFFLALFTLSRAY
jgi:hypothetical protein